MTTSSHLQNGGDKAETEVVPSSQNACAAEDDHVAAVEVSRRKVPDGGWGWMCVLGSAIAQVIFGVIIRAFGVTYLALLERFGASATATAWVGAINFAGTGFLGPVVSILCRRYGCRPVTMIGGVLVAVGVIATGYAPNIYVTYVTYGLITGIGLGLAYTPGIIIVGLYFEKRKALAMAMASFSSGLGALISPPLLLLLLREYGFSGMLLVVGGLCLNVCVSGALYRPLEQPNRKDKLLPKTPEDTDNELKKGPSKSEGVIPDIIIVDADEELLNKEKEQEEEEEKLAEEKKLDTNQQLTKVYTNCDEKHPYSCSETNINLSAVSDAEGTDGTTEKKTDLSRIYIDLLKCPTFLALTFALFALAFSLGLVSGFLPALAVDNGINTDNAAWLLSISGICSMISTLVLGPLLDVPVIRRYRLHIYNAMNLAAGASTFLFAVVTNFGGYAAMVTILSGAAGVLMSQRATVVTDAVGRGMDAEGFGVILLVSSVGSLLGRSVAGSFKDRWGTYKGAFYLSGAVQLFSVVLVQLSLIHLKMAATKKKCKKITS